MSVLQKRVIQVKLSSSTNGLDRQRSQSHKLPEQSDVC